MTQGSTNPGAGSGDLPWASVFDPSVNVRAMGEIQQRGFRAATELVNRFVRLAEPPAADLAASPGTNVGKDVDRVLAALQRLTEQFNGALREPNSHPSHPVFDFASGCGVGQVLLGAQGAGSCSGEVWLHNSSAVELGKARLRCSDLMSHGGAVIAADLVRFEPDEVVLLARSSRGVTIEVDLPDEQPAGTYRGTLVVEGCDDVWLPVALTLTRVPG